ncbi:hypothetical protein ANCCEY_11426 [Ancylostoma ceylanicum]|uniref:Uncharacterized protein n=1 Tax=Ancylostoma ceylanicum TaxID=53326 RepID=A0A0D6LE66_9BILA|nr:hypothetical protein ANCCEY_11426 [Ancylostoma ceylanicum]
MGSKGPVFALVVSVMMVVTGSLNTICAKWADRIHADGIPFNHPFLQTWLKSHQDSLTASTSGALIVCTGLLSIFMVAAKIPGFKWMGMLLVVMGLVVVGVTDILCGDHVEHSKQDIIVGDVLCVVAQVFVALQLVLEQKYMAKYDVEPLFAVGLEGIYGLVLLIIALVPLYYIHVPPVFSTNPEGRLEDLFYAWKQINMEPMIAVALSGTTIRYRILISLQLNSSIGGEKGDQFHIIHTLSSIAFFNYAGVSVTKELSATTRTVIDSIRTIVIWAASIPLFHAKFIPYQVSP